MDTEETSWMWSWIKGNQKWLAWNKCKGKKFSFFNNVSILIIC